MDNRELTPKEIVRELDRYIIGQDQAKRAVAIAIRNRIRRMKLPEELRREVSPKNILMIGPTGVGKTEIARRLSQVVDAPFVKVEATKFTEVGYVGRDVDSMVRDLVEVSVQTVKRREMEKVRAQARLFAEDRLLEYLYPNPQTYESANPLEMIFQGVARTQTKAVPPEIREKRENARGDLRRGLLDNVIVEIEVESSTMPAFNILSGAGMDDLGINMQNILDGILPKKKTHRKTTVKEALRILEEEEAKKLIDEESAIREGVIRAEQSGIIFIDEMDKIAGRERGAGPDVSREGVQRDLLPIVEGSTVNTRYGPVRTDFILFIGAGAFHETKPSDLIPELQGRFPIRVELEPLKVEDFVRILTQPENALIKQYTMLLATEGVNLRFTESAIYAIARRSFQLNEELENIGARRLYTVTEKVLEDISFNAPDTGNGEITIDENYIEEKLSGILEERDISKYIL
ncbi:MAG: ATP-dependent protease ATPase subunit HslU [Dictyoglomi bacterium]|nr:ATP-dependent protease ATPase subunit HslU [Dictyoglomota bacterium]